MKMRTLRWPVVVALALGGLLMPAPARAQDGGDQAASKKPSGPIRRMPDGKPDLTGFFGADAGGSNYGLERHERDFLTPAGRGVIVDPPDGKLPTYPWVRAERLER